MSKKNRDPDGLSKDENAAILQNESQQAILNQGNNNNQDTNDNLPSLNPLESQKKSKNGENISCDETTPCGVTIPNGICTDNCICCTGSNGLADSTKSALDQMLVKITALTASLNSVQQNVGSLYVGGEDEKIFYDRKVRPLVDMLYFLTQSAQGSAITAQNMQANAYAKKKQIKLPIDLSYEIVKEAYCVFETLKRRNAIYRHMIERDIKSSGCLNEKYYKSSFCDLEDDYFEELDNCYNRIYND